MGRESNFPDGFLRSNMMLPLSCEINLRFFHISPGNRGKPVQLQCSTQRKTPPEISFGRVLQVASGCALFQRAFCNFTAVSGVCCRSLRNLFAQDQSAGVAAGQVQSAGLAVLAAQLFDSATGGGQLLFPGCTLHGKEVAAHLYQRQAVLCQHGQGCHGAGRSQIKLLPPDLARGFLGALLYSYLW